MVVLFSNSNGNGSNIDNCKSMVIAVVRIMVKIVKTAMVKVVVMVNYIVLYC